MVKPLAALLFCLSITANFAARADYAKGCEDPDYAQYMKQRYAHFEALNRRLFNETLQDYERSLATSTNPYQVIGDLSRHLRYSAQFEPVEVVNAKIDRIFEHAEALSLEQQIAGEVVDRFSSESHSVGIARAWIAYRQENYELAFTELLQSLEISDSAVLSTFGPDLELIRRMYRDGHVAPVVAYINKTEEFWKGRRPDSLRYVWEVMIEAQCAIQFDFVDTIKALELGLRVMDVNRDYGLSR
uniref:hypothetical protein n=1 Tax=Ningiella ruwaisensis TaxID=2364274 RepID=UPI00109F729B|nr:hypothetical protein [Ningiella ruwaisensis]